MNEPNPLLSLIVPAYNVEDYLVECLNSIYAITEDKFEVIIVNDGSTDSSLQIAQQYKKKYPDKTTVIDQSNKGLSAARNAGLIQAKGCHVTFVDSDDLIEPKLLIELFKHALTHNTDIICGNGYRYYNGKLNKNEEDVHIKYAIELEKLGEVSGKIFLHHVFKHSALGVINAWGKVFNRKFLIDNSFYFLKGLKHEDVPFTIETMLSTSKVCLLNKHFYYYRQRPGSIMSTLDESSANSRIEIVKYVLKLTVSMSVNERSLNDYLAYQLRRANEILPVIEKNLVWSLLKRKISMKYFMYCLILLIKFNV